MIITLDGPAGSGKTTLARRLAQRLGCQYLDSGAMYRAVAVKVLRMGVALNDNEALGATARESRVELRGAETRLDGENVSAAIRKPEIADALRAVAACAGVRSELGKWQRAMGESTDLVADGRDMGTVIFPNAPIKFFLTASAEARAERRMKEMIERGEQVTFEEVLAAQKERDFSDESREHAPLQPADDAIHVDTSAMTLDEAMKHLVTIINERTA